MRKPVYVNDPSRFYQDLAEIEVSLCRGKDPVAARKLMIADYRDLLEYVKFLEATQADHVRDELED